MLNRFLILLLMMAAFALRLGHWLAGIYHIDEYISMLAALMTTQTGAPILPSGLLYHQGLLLSYLAAPWLGLTGFSEELSRWPSILVGILAVAAFYRVGSRVFGDRLAGLLALTLAALDPAMILWAARMRMYALALLLMLLALYFLLQGTLLQPNRRDRLLAATFYLGAILVHSVAVVALPVWGLALLICLVMGHKEFQWDWYRQKGLIIEIIFALTLLVVGLAFGIGGQIPFLSPGNAGGQDSGGGLVGVFNKFLDLGLSWARVDDFIYTYTTPEYWPLTGLALISLGWAGFNFWRGQLTRRDLAALFLGLVVILTIAELGLALTSTWRKTRYLFILCHPAILLLAAAGLARLFRLLTAAGRRQIEKRHLASSASAWLLPTACFLLPVLLIAFFWLGPAFEVATAQGTGSYDTAFEWVKERWQEGDRLMTVHPSAAYLYLGHSDYYATQGTARLLADNESEEQVDRYVGSDLVDSVVALNRTLAESRRLWFVVDTDRLFSRYEPLFTQQVFAQMDVVHQAGPVLVFLSRPYPRPAPAQPEAMLQANFNHLIELSGYSLDWSTPTPDRTVQLSLYWRPLTGQFTSPYKVFVQLRNQENQTVAQADHFIYEGYLTNGVMSQLQVHSEWLRDTADLTLPDNLPPGDYRLLVGLYNPDTFERVPVLNDASGENAVLLETISVP
jgi:hypothetical protein